jgi:hypothetical protein
MSKAMNRAMWSGVVVATLGGAACVQFAPAPTANQLSIAQRKWASATLGDLERGRISYLERCAGCHVPYAPSRFPSDMWPKLVADMRRNANLNRPEDEEDIVRYLVTASEALREPRQVKSARIQQGEVR